MRLFVAAFPPPPVLADLERVMASLRVRTRVVSPERRHLTLAFLGEVGEDRVPDARDALTAAATGQPTVEVRLEGGGYFGRGRSTTLWAGVRGEVEPLAEAVRDALRRAGLSYDDKPFRPHLTLARPGEGSSIRDDLVTLSGWVGPSWTVDAIHLVRSPAYDRLHTEPLGRHRPDARTRSEASG